MFTLAIAGRPVAVTDAEEREARELFDSQDFKEDLLAMTSEGRPLWDGSAALDVRPASADEVDAFGEILDEEGDDLQASSDDGQGDDEGGGINVLFLVPIDDAGGQSAAAH
jgi:hypothetical protein